MIKECPKCKKDMVRTSHDQSIEERWLCTNPACLHEETKYNLKVQAEKPDEGKKK